MLSVFHGELLETLFPRPCDEKGHGSTLAKLVEDKERVIVLGDERALREGEPRKMYDVYG